MLAKVLVGVLVAASVTLSGVYFAFYSGTESSGCSKCSAVPVSEGSCCLKMSQACNAPTTEISAEMNTGMGAFAGGVAYANQPEMKLGCCDE